jgi:subtilisin family serine protease
MSFFRIYFTFIVSLQLFSQSPSKYWVLFKDKNLTDRVQLSERCLENRAALGLALNQYSDIPLQEAYLTRIQELNIPIIQKSKWLNAISVSVTDDQLVQVKALSFVKEVIPLSTYLIPAHTDDALLFGIRRKKRDTLKTPDPSEALKLINYSYLEKEGYTGKGVLVGVTDAGYTNLDRQDYFKKAMTENRVLGTKDFLNPSREVGIFENLTGKDTHGREVTKCIAGLSDKEQFGVAFDAKFYFARTENAKEERRLEEDAWVAAMEWFDSLGVRLVNSSLGYGKGFDIPSESYGNHQMNGYTTVIAKAAQIATTQKEMILVNSAGNSGADKEWKGYISSPADVPTVMSVGATDAYSGKMGYSSIGPEYNGFIKPDISAFSKNGTSFSSPLIAGVVACILQKHDKWCNDQIKNALYASGNLYPYKNNYIGYGVPDCSRLVRLLDGKEVKDSTTVVYAQDSTYKIETVDEVMKLCGGKSKITTFRTQVPGFILGSETFEANKQSYSFKRMQNESYCVLLAGGRKYVIIWPEAYIEDKILESDAIDR